MASMVQGSCTFSAGDTGTLADQGDNMRLKFTGTGPAQGESIFIGGRRFVRGEMYTVTKDEAQNLLKRGGFDVVNQSTQKETSKE